MTLSFLKDYTKREKWSFFGIILVYSIMWSVGALLIVGPCFDWIADNQAVFVQITLGLTVLVYALIFLFGFTYHFVTKHRTRLGITPTWTNREIDKLESSVEINVSHLQSQIDDLTRKVDALEKEKK